MSVCLCNLSADTILELVAQKKLEIGPATPDPLSLQVDPTLVKNTLGDLIDDLPRPLELLIGNPNRRRSNTEIVSHVWKGPLPSNSVFLLDEGVYVTSPELTLLQQANQLHQVNLCQMLGRYLGTWTPVHDSQTGQQARGPLTTLESLNLFIARMGKVRGKNNLRLAMAYTCEGAASAPETALQLALSLPPELHGLNMPQPIMNYEVDLSTQAQILYPHESIRIDLCWRNKGFGLEYQGEEHGNQLGEDYARWFAARKENYELWFVAKEQLESAEQMMHIGREVARRIDCNVDEGLWPTKSEFQNLLDTLAGRRHPKPISYDDLRALRAKQRQYCRQSK